MGVRMTLDLPEGWRARQEEGFVEYISPCETVRLFDSYINTPYGSTYDRLRLVDAELRKLKS